MTPLEQYAIYGPLDHIADVVTLVGKTTAKDVYSTLQVDGPNRRVEVWLTKSSVRNSFLHALKKADPHIDTRRLVFRTAQYNLTQMHAARDRLMAQVISHSLPFEVYAVAVQQDGSGLDVEVDHPQTAKASAGRVRALTAQRGTGTDSYDGIKVVFNQGHPNVPTDQAQTKWDDGSPQIGGDTISNGHNYCTAGIPAVTSSGTNVMITANHCFPSNTDVYTPGGAHPAFGSYYQGLNGVLDFGSHYVGTVTGNAPQWDAEELTGGKNNADVQLSDTWHPVTSIRYSYMGDPVCQSGAASYYMGYGNVCGIHVVNPDITWTSTDWSGTHSVRGVRGTRAPNSNWAVAEGDSGGLVYFQTGTNSYQARGIVSAGYGPCCYTYNGNYAAYQYIDWTEAPDILGHFGLSLNPTT